MGPAQRNDGSVWLHESQKTVSGQRFTCATRFGSRVANPVTAARRDTCGLDRRGLARILDRQMMQAWVDYLDELRGRAMSPHVKLRRAKPASE
jgi:hypothetical protein